MLKAPPKPTQTNLPKLPKRVTACLDGLSNLELAAVIAAAAQKIATNK